MKLFHLPESSLLSFRKNTFYIKILFQIKTSYKSSRDVKPMQTESCSDRVVPIAKSMSINCLYNNESAVFTVSPLHRFKYKLAKP